MKKMTLTITIVSVVMVGLMVLTLGHFRHGFAHSGDHGKAYFVEKVTQELELNADQQGQLDEIVTHLHEERVAGREFRQTVRADLLAALKQDMLDRQELDRIYGETKERVETVYDLLAASLVDFHQTLTPLQRDKLVAKIENHSHHRGPFGDRGCRWKE